MAYSQQSWNTGDPITQEKMRTIEKGIEEAHQGLSLCYTKAEITEQLVNMNNAISTAQNTANNAIIDAAAAIEATKAGQDAWTYVSGAMIFDPDTNEVTKNLATRLNEMDQAISNSSRSLGQVVSEITAARGQLKYYGNHARAENLKEKLDDMDLKIDALEGAITTTDGDYDTARGSYNTLAARLSAIDHDSTKYLNKSMSEHLDDVETEIATAHASSVNSSNYASLDARFEAEETAIVNLGAEKVDYTDIIDNLNQTDTNKPLSANQGNIIKRTLGPGFDTDTHTVAAAINTAQTNAQSNANDYSDTHKVDKTDIYNGVDYTTDDEKVLDARVGKTLKDAIDATNIVIGADDTTGLRSRIAALETEIDNANGDSTLDARFDAIEANIDTIAGELNMTDVSGLKTIGTRVDDLDAHITTMATELGMIQSGEIVDTNTRVDALESELQTARGSSADLDTRLDGIDTAISGINTRVDTIETDLNTATTGLKAKVAAVESTLNAAETGVLARLTTAESDIDTIEGDLNTATTGLKARVSTLETNVGNAATAITTLQGKDTIVVSAPVSGSNFENGIPNINNATTDADYLIQADDGKYYYWRLIGEDWELISGAGGSGSGNSNAADYASTALFEADITENGPEGNKDYYVLESDGIRHHYRYLYDSSEDTWNKIEIGLVVDTSKIKRYNIATENATVNGEDVTYLNLYQYDYNEPNNNIDTERQPLTQIILPKGGGGGSASSSINKLIRIGDQTIQKIVGTQILLRVFYSSWDSSGTESSSGDYVLKAGDTTISSGTFNSGAFNADLTQGWQDNTTGYYEFDVGEYCNVGNTTFTLAVTVNGTTLGKSWTVNVIDLHLESNAPEVLLIPTSESYDFPYTPFGALSKTLHVIIDDDTEHEITVSLSSVTSGRASTVTIPAQDHNAHKIEIYLEATVGGVQQITPSIIREYIWYDATNNTTILASPYNERTITAQQYSTIDIPYQVYKKDATSITVEYYLDSEQDPFDSVTLEDVNTGILSYLASTQGSHTLTIKVDNISITVSLNITELEINVSPVVGAIIDFDPTTLTNSSVNRLPSWTVGGNTYSLTASSNFNWSDDANGGGYKTDEDGRCFVIKAGSYVDLDYPMFAGNGSNNILTNGAEMKIIFKTEAVRDVNAVWFQNTGTLTEKTVGIQLGAHYGWLKTDKATDTTTSSAGSEYDAWVSGTGYAVNTIVVYEDVIYKCIKDCADRTIIIPGTTDGNTYWTLLTGDNIPSDTSGIAAWASGTAYDKDTIVSYSTAYYKCKKAVINELTTDPKTASDNWLSMGKIDTEVLATNSYLYFPYSEEDKIELDININKYNANAETNFIMSYEDGVPSKAYAYEYGTAGDGLYHSNTIRIGSNDCDVYIYRLRIYNKSLDTEDILQNFIADGNGINEKVSRYNRNCIYWDETQGKYFTSPSATAVLDPIKLAEVIPDVKILMLDTPVFTTGKKNFVQGSSLRCIQADGGTVYASRGDADNWFFMNGFHSGQGTTSDNYGQSARNVDFLFEVDGTHYPTKKKNMGSYTPSNEYVSQVLIGKNASTWNGTTWEAAREATAIEICDDWKGDKCKISLTESSVPNNYFNLKVNVASSENVNNALFQKRYNDFLVYSSPAQAAQITEHRTGYTALGLNPSKIKVRNGMEFVPAILFVRENEEDLSKHTEFKDRNWHFYALGNIGDSKKTDYTRAYDPDDMNEFTCENSDNNTNNGQFQSGVFTYNGHRAIETPYAAYDSEKTYTANDIVVDDGVIKVYNGSAWSNATLSGWTDFETPYFAPYSAPNPMQYLFPITSSEWNVKIGSDYANYKHNTLVNEEFDGDHSFEFRYACRGDYRDGDLINESDGQDDDAQFDLNHDVMLAFYEWLITATEEQYAAEAPQWFVKSAMEFFYAYTHYYTMMDNRAKNTFWHFAKTGTRRAVPIGRATPALMHVYEESDGNGGYQAASGEFDNTKQYYTEYAFDLWVYDTDTAAGIDNNGALVFPYGKEDEDYRTEGDPSSGYAFNGAGSIFWRRLKKTFSSEIVEVMSSTDPNCFNSTDLINEFDRFQNCFPEEIWRLDIERKYIRTFTGESVDNSIQTGKQNPRFLTSMMQGRKKYQRRQWIRDQGVYFNSKYRLSDITSNSNTIEFNCTTPADIQDIALTPSYYLQLTPYQDMYLNVQVGNGNYKDSYITPDGSKNLRAKAGQTYTFDLSGNYQETRIYINGANHLSAIGNLAAMYPYSFDLRALAHIKTLDIGTDVAGYTNTKFTELKLPTFMPLLESLNIKNCHSVAGTISLSTANNIRTVEATGTAITGVSLPDYTSIQSLHIPSTVTAVNLYGARQLTDFKVYNNAGTNDYSTLYKLHVYDSDYSANIDWLGIASDMLVKQSLETEISLLKLSLATITNIQELEPFRIFKSPLETAGGIMTLGGTIHVTGDWSEIEKTTYETTWPSLTLDVIDDSEHKKVKHLLTYSYEVNGVPTTYSVYVNNNASITDIYDNGTIEIPTRPSTAQYNYTFGSYNASNEYIELSGWRIQGDSETLAEKEARLGYTPRVTSNTVIEAVFTSELRRYPVKWYLNENDVTPVKTSAAVAYGAGTTLEAPTVADIHTAGFDTASIIFNRTANPVEVTYKIFNGWEKLPININPSASDTSYNIYATWLTGTNVGLPTIFEDTSNLTPVQLYVFGHMSDAERAQYVPIGTQFSMQLGYQGLDNSGELLIGPGSTHMMTNSRGTQSYQIARFDNTSSTRPFESSLQPLKAGSDEFTLAIDYSFNAEAIEAQTANEAVLMSCYEKNSSTTAGFRLYYRLGEGPKVSFGDTTVDGGNITYARLIGTPATAKYRNTIVLRHPANSTVLYIYSGVKNETVNRENGSILTDTLDTNFIQTIEWNNINTNAKLVFGNLSLDNESSTMIAAKGIIYWAKYWNKDLGAGECRNLACWNHETMTFGIEEYAGMNSALTRNVYPDSVGTPPNTVITSLNTSSYGHISVIAAKTTDDIIQWPYSKLQEVANKRIFLSFPIAMQSVITKSPVRSRQVKLTSGTYANSYTIGDTDVQRSNDYVFFPSSVEYGNTNTSYKGHEANGMMNWRTAAHIAVYSYNSGTNTWISAAADASYMDIRFPGPAIRTGETPNRIFTNYIGTDPIYSKIDDIQRGDIVIYNDSDAYIYVTSADIVAGANVVIPSGTSDFFYCSGGGGWVKADQYWTRSPFDNNGGYGTFMYISGKGTLINNPTAPDNNGYGFNYSFSI